MTRQVTDAEAAAIIDRLDSILADPRYIADRPAQRRALIAAFGEGTMALRQYTQADVDALQQEIAEARRQLSSGAPLRAGDVLHGFCGGHFGRDSYADKRVEAIGADWVVAREDNGRAVFHDGDPDVLTEYRDARDPA